MVVLIVLVLDHEAPEIFYFHPGLGWEHL